MYLCGWVPPFPMPAVCPNSDLTPLLGTVLLFGGGFDEGVHQVHSPYGFGTGAG